MLETKKDELQQACFAFRVDRGCNHNEQGMAACRKCPLYKNSMCSEIFDGEGDIKADIETIEKALQIMSDLV